MNKDEQEYIDALKLEIIDLEDKLKFMTEERDQALLLAQSMLLSMHYKNNKVEKSE